MRIEAPEQQAVARAYLWLTLAEARELRDSLDDLLASVAEPDWHAHISSSDYQTELTVALQRE